MTRKALETKARGALLFWSYFGGGALFGMLAVFSSILQHDGALACFINRPDDTGAHPRYTELRL